MQGEMEKMVRTWNEGQVVHITTSLSTTARIEFGSFSTGLILVPAGSGIGTLTFYACATVDGTYLPVYTYDGTAAVITVTAGRAYEFPPGVYATRYMKILADAADTVTITVKS